MLPVDYRIRLGHYDRPPAIRTPFGVQAWMRVVHEADKNGYTAQAARLTLAATFPYEHGSKSLERLRPAYWENQEAYYWSFQQAHEGIRLWCLCDLLDRLLDLPEWKNVEEIPLFARLPGKGKETLTQAVAQINAGRWNPDPPVLPQYPALPLNELRHNYTPYDYLWQTGRGDRDSLHAHWNSILS